jgi:hypothetical protein
VMRVWNRFYRRLQLLATMSETPGRAVAGQSTATKRKFEQNLNYYLIQVVNRHAGGEDV